MKPHCFHTRHRRSGFSLMEVLVAMGIFTLGFVAVAAIFPVAAILQRNSADQVLAEHAKRNAKAYLTARGMTYDKTAPVGASDLYFYHHSSPGSATGYTALRPFSASLFSRWTLNDRSYPSTIADVNARNLYWVPFIRDRVGDELAPDWKLYLFVLKRENSKNYTRPTTDDPTDWANPDDGKINATTWAVPGVKRIGVSVSSTNRRYFNFGAGKNNPRVLRMNDLLLSSDGVIYKVTEADDNGVTVNGTIALPDPDEIWFSPAADGDTYSPTQSILIITPNVTDI